MSEYKDVTELIRQIADVKREQWDRRSCENISYIIGYVSALSLVEGMIASIPEADVVEVVRCKDCIFNESGVCTHSENYDSDNYHPNWYCADGIRKDG